MLYQLPPAGNPVVYSDLTEQRLPAALPLSDSRMYASGTAALAAAIMAVIKVKNISEAEIIMPAYACPDLVSAVIYAGARPVLVDLEAESPWLSLAQCSAAVNSRTSAIVGVNLFGISERWPLLRALTSKKKIFLIEDSAQYFPGKDEGQHWHGDLVVLSFGRGKPVSMLGGGAVISQNKTLFRALPQPARQAAGCGSRLTFAFKSWLYNAMISPYIYWLPQSLSFLHLGETRYHTLPTIDGIDDTRRQLLPVNVARYQNDEQAQQRCTNLSAMLAPFDAVIDLPQLCQAAPNRRLLRYPILLPPQLRDEVYSRLLQAGVGVSKMYPTILPEIEGLQNLQIGRDYPQAVDFASRILTLPTHEKLQVADIVKMQHILSEVSASKLS